MKPWILPTTDPKDLSALLDLARPGMSIAAWRELGHATLPQVRAADRERVLRVGAELLDVTDTAITAEPFLRLFHESSPRARQHLLTARRYGRSPWVQAAATYLVIPTLVGSEAPLARRTSRLSTMTWTTFVDAHIDASASRWARDQTRIVLTRALLELGCLKRMKGDFHVTNADPAPEAIAWLLRAQLDAEHRLEMSNAEAITRSEAAQAYCLRGFQVHRAIEKGEALSLLRQSYLAGAPRILPWS